MDTHVYNPAWTHSDFSLQIRFLEFLPDKPPNFIQLCFFNDTSQHVLIINDTHVEKVIMIHARFSICKGIEQRSSFPNLYE